MPVSALRACIEASRAASARRSGSEAFICPCVRRQHSYCDHRYTAVKTVRPHIQRRSCVLLLTNLGPI